MIKYQYLTAMD